MDWRFPHPIQQETWKGWVVLVGGSALAVLATLGHLNTARALLKELSGQDLGMSMLQALTYVLIVLGLFWIYRGSQEWPHRLNRSTIGFEASNITGTRQLWIRLVNNADAPIRDVDLILVLLRDWDGRKFVENTYDIQPMIVHRVPVMEPAERHLIKFADGKQDLRMDITGQRLSVNWKPLDNVRISINRSGVTRKAILRVTHGRSCRDETVYFFWNAGAAPELCRNPGGFRALLSS